MKQTVLPNKIIIGDDSPNDETEEWIKIFKQKQTVEIEYIHNRPSLKQAANVEMLMQRVETDYLLLLHDDDYLLQNALEDLLQLMFENPEIDVAFGKQYIVDQNGVINEKGSVFLNQSYLRSSSYENKILNPLHVALNQQLPSNSFLLRTSLAKEVHYDFEVEAGDAIDFMFCLNLAKANARFRYADKFISAYRHSANSVSTNGTVAYDAYKLVEQLSIPGIDNQQLQKEFLCKKAPGAVVEALKKKNRKDALRIYFSEYHRNKILTFGGIKRGIMVLFGKSFLLL
ncbi:family 2 glycosyl transferase [Sporocytophaga myxococcoides]|uniref:Family 2 glycosyl transferase n=1 Tax=Sporocytophaga myxococcoides TaxID=153721 RepID=A0A098LCS5_9BACT|nr:family 2 glycosyl transferase [Sporocytophaga myxococcoides]